MALAFGPMGPSLWSHNTVSASSTRDIGLASRRLRQWFLRSLDSPIDLALLSKFNPDTQGDMSLVTSVIIRHMSRIRSLRSVVFDTFATLFPLNGDLASLQVLDVHTSDRSSGDASSQGTPILLSGSAPNLSRFSLNISPTSLPFDLLQVFTELSTLAAVSSLTITVEDAPPTIFQALESFVKLQYLNWTQSEDEDKILAPSEAPAISLPVLRTLLVTGSSALKGLAAIQGPVLENIAIRGEVFAPERVELTKKYAQFLTKGQTCPRLKTLRVSSPLFIGNIMISNAMLHALYWEGPALSLARHFKTIADWVSRSPSTHRINPTLEFLVVHCLDIESAATEILGSLADHMERCVIAIDTGASFHDESYEHFKFKLGISPELARSSSRFMELLTGYPTLIVETSEKYDLVFEQH
ncbi:hypothetical protein DL93DRAFT_840781 [Clavulina sp. PMI_390]|nr:hypothetical protein DL93DRAFT_840781 [Clavulina sp. PMI_390]